MVTHNETGRNGESAARSYLERKGYSILHSNWHFHHYELDLVATRGDELVIVEVKTRSSRFLLSPEEAVDAGKIKRTVIAADAYARTYNISLPIRFDIITLIRQQNESFEIEHIEDAFIAPCH